LDFHTNNNTYALHDAIATLIGHSIVIIVLQTAYREVVVPDSIRAMTIRIFVWAAILILLLIQAWKERLLMSNKNKVLPV